LTISASRAGKCQRGKYKRWSQPQLQLLWPLRQAPRDFDQ
jgi:hypothetical protein